MDMKKLHKEHLEHQKVLAKQCYIEKHSIIINLAYEYPIALRRCSTPEAILGWVRQLSEKSWITVPVIRRFIALATTHHKIDINHI